MSSEILMISTFLHELPSLLLLGVYKNRSQGLKDLETDFL